MATMPLIEATEEMVAELGESLAGEAKFDWLTRQIYSTDASMYRVVPAGVVFPKDGDDVAAAVEIAGRYDVPVVPRGGGTSISGQTIGNGLVIDYSRHINRIIELNPQEQWVHVEAGANLEWLNARLRAHDLIVGPDPASAKGNTLGGMTANNSTGTHSIVYGMMGDQVHELFKLIS
ncbi:MAG: FAD-binding oxidoreductase [Ardenticatenaceae bacterium]